MIRRHTAVLAALAVLPLAACDNADQKPELDRLRAENAALAQKAQAAESDRSADKLQISDLHKQITDAASRFGEITRELGSAKELRAAAEAKLAALGEELDDARGQVAELQASLSKSLEDARAAAQRYEGEIASLRDQVADLQAKLAEALRNLNPDRLRELLPGQTPPGQAPR
jgi:chromosome segregation ATPase